ncbi:ATP-binding protein [Pseudooceanicola aestuarii]|uniref:ATP-binding protein n=1 Tax=Pseudooceanicola aestuarii TaxID=2697319 RepID=UPI0013D47304|nr:ATP-binding protein [Pseudooceanicola aestuarii]
MKNSTFQMINRLDAVDPMVLALKDQVAGPLEGEALLRFDISVTEALTNLVLHARTPLPEAEITITLHLEDDEVRIDIFDPIGAAPFDLRQSARALSDVDAMAEGGRGLGLIVECADGVDYGAIRQRNRLCLTFRGRV